MAKITLASGGVVLVDDEVVPLLAGYRWGKGSRDYVIANSRQQNGAVVLYMHRIIAGASEGEEVDHINGNTFDNRRENLRICTHAENMRNRKVHKNNRLGVKGVYLARGKFRAEININKKKIRLGVFATLEAAALSYRLAAVKYHGEFCRPI